MPDPRPGAAEPAHSPSPAPTAQEASGPLRPDGTVVVVGAGLAGAQTVASLRRHGFGGTITLLGGEGVPPYDRPPLSKELLTRTEPAWLTEELGVDVTASADTLLLDDPAVDLVPAAEHVTVTTRSGRTLTADVAVLATGSRPVRPAGWETATTLHTAADAAALRSRLVPGQRVVAIGAGWIGAEVAGVAAGAGCAVTVVEAAAHPLERQLGPRVGAHLARWYAQAGARLVTGARVVEVHDGGVRLADGTHLEADVVLAAVGALPATGWLDGRLPRGPRGELAVDVSGRVRAPEAHGRVWAVGDCATREHPVFGAVPGGHWSAALHDPEPTVAALLGAGASSGTASSGTAASAVPAVPLVTGLHAPYVFSQQLGHSLALFGLPSPDHEVLLRGDPGGGVSGHDGWTALYLDRPRAVSDLVPGTHRGVPGTDQGTAPGHRGDARPEGTDGAAGGRRLATVRAVLVVDAPREVGAVRKLMNRPVPLVVDLDVVADPARRLRDAVVAPVSDPA